MGQATRLETSLQTRETTPAHSVVEEIRSKETQQSSFTLAPIKLEPNETATSFLRKVAFNFGLEKQVLTRLSDAPFFITEKKRVSCTVIEEGQERFAQITVTRANL